MSYSLSLPPVEAGVVFWSNCLKQFRIHSSTNTHVLLNVASLPVIEHCTNVAFGAYPSFLLSTQPASLFIYFLFRAFTDMKQAYESRHTQVQDFDWVRGGQSPNWSLLSKDQASTLFTQEMASRLYDEGINVREKEKGEHMAMEWTERLIELSALHPS